MNWHWKKNHENQRYPHLLMIIQSELSHAKYAKYASQMWNISSPLGNDMSICTELLLFKLLVEHLPMMSGAGGSIPPVTSYSCCPRFVIHWHATASFTDSARLREEMMGRGARQAELGCSHSIASVARGCCTGRADHCQWHSLRLEA